jgi:hypothetical protein
MPFSIQKSKTNISSGTVLDKDTTYEWWTNCNLYYWPDEFIGTPRKMQSIINHAKQLKMDGLFYSKT